eukprot:TRINITY_DN3421_c0_g1_i2.p2 TRINITY_DN3421_c0_g1~~TRINITY_DN3421_c0_g1_i2.p2  ORF type:complete len:235 (-),score=61.13 TRINITY_DN3421_c0_g1_i2:21-725(-)
MTFTIYLSESFFPIHVFFLFKSISDLFFSDGSTYEGEYKDDNRNGLGTYHYKNGSKYVGNWTDGKRNGQGKETYASGDIYEGEFKDGARDGIGQYWYFNGSLYVGQWSGGEKKGRGRIQWNATGFSYDGMWVDNKPVDEEACLHPDLKRAVEDGKCTGVVTLTELNYGQFLTGCVECKKYYCKICFPNSNCCAKNHTCVRKFYVTAYCQGSVKLAKRMMETTAEPDKSKRPKLA